MHKTADVIIIGGGIHGASLAFHLARAGAGRIVLLEKNSLAGGPTARSGALIRPLFREAIYIELVLKSTEIFEQWDEIVGGEAGFVQHGFLRISRSFDIDVLGGDIELMRRLGVALQILGSEDLRRCAPGVAFRGDEVGLFLPKGGFADPILTTLSLARAAQRLGVEILEGTEVTGLVTRGGRLEAVVTRQGTLSTRLAVNCSGAWADKTAAMAQVQIPIEAHRTPTFLFRQPEIMRADAPIVSDGVHRVYLRAAGPGLVRAGHFGWARDPADPDDYDETVSSEQLRGMRSLLSRHSDAFRRAPYQGGFSALYDMTPDAHPIVGPSPEIAGLWCNAGWSGNGFAGAPAAGGSLAAEILGGSRPEHVDLTPFRWPRSPGVTDRREISWIHR